MSLFREGIVFEDTEKHTNMVSNHLRKLYINKIPKHEWQGFHGGFPALSSAVYINCLVARLCPGPSDKPSYLSANLSSFRDKHLEMLPCAWELPNLRNSKRTKHSMQNSQKSWLIHDGICKIILPVTKGGLGSKSVLKMQTFHAGNQGWIIYFECARKLVNG